MILTLPDSISPVHLKLISVPSAEKKDAADIAPVINIRDAEKQKEQQCKPIVHCQMPPQPAGYLRIESHDFF